MLKSMVVARVSTATLSGFDGVAVDVETDMKQGLPGVHIVGMGNKAVTEARERVRSAITNSLLTFPARKLTVNLAPAEVPKQGAHLDLPIALSILIASGQLPQAALSHAGFVGELSLTGALKPIKGCISLTETMRSAGIKYLYLPAANQPQAALVNGVQVIGVTSLKELFLHLKGITPISPPSSVSPPQPTRSPLPQLDEIKGQAHAKRALQIAVAGRHNLLLCGPPGAGKTLLAQALAGLLPPLNPEEQLAVTKIHSLGSLPQEGLIQDRPFRAPHHTTSRTALIGGGAHASPGEISLAHLGVLFLDELPEYPRGVLEALRQPLEEKVISVTRSSTRSTYPADFMLVAAMNPCPCGYVGDPRRACSCSTTQILAYQKRISGPLLDRIDLVVHLSNEQNLWAADDDVLPETQQSKVVTLINAAITCQKERYKSSVIYNANLTSALISRHCQLSPAGTHLLRTAAQRLALTNRATLKLIKVARTIADLAGADQIEPIHLNEALQFRDSLQP